MRWLKQSMDPNSAGIDFMMAINTYIHIIKILVAGPLIDLQTQVSIFHYLNKF